LSRQAPRQTGARPPHWRLRPAPDGSTAKSRKSKAESVFADGARIQEEAFGNRLIACDLANADFVKFAESFGTSGSRAHGRDELRRALREASAQREPSVIEVPVGVMPSPWEFIHMPPVRGR